jgi:hypothetical protein
MLNLVPGSKYRVVPEKKARDANGALLLPPNTSTTLAAVVPLLVRNACLLVEPSRRLDLRCHNSSN